MIDLPLTLHTDLLVVDGVWIGYAVLHSALAMTRTKRALGSRCPAAARGDLLWAWRGMWGWFANGVAFAALIGFVLTLGHYSTAHFVGTAQWRARAQDAGDEAPLAFSPLHRFVRHPWYYLALYLIWTREMDAAHLVAAVILGLYLVLGSRIEERRLIAAYGERYHRYQRRVPAPTPLLWRHRSASTLGESAAGPESDGLNLESSVGRGEGCVCGGAGQGTMMRNSRSIAKSCNAALRVRKRAIHLVACFPRQVNTPISRYRFYLSRLPSE